MKEIFGSDYTADESESRDASRIVFGNCRRCGGEPEGGFPSLGGADADRYTDQNQRLILFRDEWMCPRCKENMIMDDESLTKRDRIRDERLFLSRLGFTQTIT